MVLRRSPVDFSAGAAPVVLHRCSRNLRAGAAPFPGRSQRRCCPHPRRPQRRAASLFAVVLRRYSCRSRCTGAAPATNLGASAAPRSPVKRNARAAPLHLSVGAAPLLPSTSAPVLRRHSHSLSVGAVPLHPSTSAPVLRRNRRLSPAISVPCTSRWFCAATAPQPERWCCAAHLRGGTARPCRCQRRCSAATHVYRRGGVAPLPLRWCCAATPTNPVPVLRRSSACTSAPVLHRSTPSISAPVLRRYLRGGATPAKCGTEVVAQHRRRGSDAAPTPGLGAVAT